MSDGLNREGFDFGRAAHRAGWDHARAQAAIAAQERAAPGYVTVNARDIAIAVNGYAGFTGDPVSFASELHERLRRTVFAGQPRQPEPAPELADERGDSTKAAVSAQKINQPAPGAAGCECGPSHSPEESS